MILKDHASQTEGDAERKTVPRQPLPTFTEDAYGISDKPGATKDPDNFRDKKKRKFAKQKEKSRTSWWARKTVLSLNEDNIRP